jgi:hypothetical protein
VEALAAIDAELRKHFASEEMSELFVDLPERMPEVAAKLGELKIQHATILDHLRRIITAVDQLDRAQDAVATQVNDLIATVRDHEQAEALLMQQAFLLE